MGFVDQILYEFDGQLSYRDIMTMTYKDLGYMREHRMQIKAKTGPSIKELFGS